MTTQIIQFVWSGVLVLLALVWLGRSAMRPERPGLLGLAYFFYCMQFCAGMLLNSFDESYFAPQDVALAFAGISLFWIGAFALGFVFRSPLPRISYLRSTGMTREKGVFLVLTEAALRAKTPYLAGLWILSLAIRVAAVVIFKIGLSGTFDTQKALAMPYWFLAAWDLSVTIGIPLAFLCLTRLLHHKPGKLLGIAIILVETLYCFTQNRRTMLGLLVVVMFAVLVYHGRIRAKFIVMGVAGLVLLWTLVFPFFYFVRWQWQNNSQALVGEWVSTAWQQTFSGKSGGSTDAYSEAVRQRFSALQFNYTVCNRMNMGQQPLYGRFLKDAALTFIPRVFFPEKLLNVKDPDSILNIAFGLPDIDQTSNLPAFGQAEFGLPGCLLYGVIFALVLRLMEGMLRTVFSRAPTGLFALFALAGYPSLQMEFQLSAFAIIFRSALIWWVVVLVISAFSRSHVSEDGASASPERLENESAAAGTEVREPAGSAERA